MKALLLGAALLALAVPAAQAQMQMEPGSEEMAQPGQQGPGRYLVFFGFNSAQLGPEARQVVTEAAQAYQRSGQAQVTVSGNTDTTGSQQYNQQLSERRARAVQAELIRQGVPAANITTIAQGEDDLLVPTGEGVREARNRRVEILVPQPPPPPPPAPVAAAPEPPPPPEPEPEPDRFTFALGPVYAHNFGESDRDDGSKTESDMAGAELTFRALPGFLGGVSLKQMALWSFNAIDEGLVGRSVASIDLAPDFGIFRPTFAINAGGVYGEGVQDGFVAGPEIRFDIAPFGGFNIGIKAAYDYQFRNAGWDEGIAYGGLDLGLRF